MRKKLVQLVALFSILLLSGCAKRVAQDELPTENEDEVELATEDEAITDQPRFIHAGVQGPDDNGIYSYDLQPEKNQLEIVYSGVTEEEWRTYTTELISFNDLEDGVEFVYIDEFGEKIEKRFKILSKSVVIDEKNNRYEWL